jgi:hypothetical protein
VAFSSALAYYTAAVITVVKSFTVHATSFSTHVEEFCSRRHDIDRNDARQKDTHDNAVQYNDTKHGSIKTVKLGMTEKSA